MKKNKIEILVLNCKITNTNSLEWFNSKFKQAKNVMIEKLELLVRELEKRLKKNEQKPRVMCGASSN
jgi:hypothetical protein